MRSDLATFGVLAAACIAPLAAADKPVMVDARIKLVSADGALGGVGIQQDKLTHVLMIPSDMLTEEIAYHGPARLQLIQMESVKQAGETATKGEAKERPSARPAAGSTSSTKKRDYIPSAKPPLAWLDLPTNQGTLHLILLVNPGKDNGITAITDTPGAFPPGSNRYFNLCQFPLKVKLPSGEQLMPGGTSKVARPGAGNTEFYDLVISSKDAEQEILAFSGRIFHQERIRKIYFIYPIANQTGRVRMKVIEDRPGYEKPPSTPPAAQKEPK